MSFGSESIRFHVLPVYRRMAEHEMFSRRGELDDFLQRQLPRGDFVTRNTDKKFKERYNSSQEISHIHVYAHVLRST